MDRANPVSPARRIYSPIEYMKAVRVHGFYRTI
jgi:hypothetical protein